MFSRKTAPLVPLACLVAVASHCAYRLPDSDIIGLDSNRSRHRTSLQPGESSTQRVIEGQGLVNLKRVIPSIIVDIPYATRNNVTGKPLYPAGMPALAFEGTATRLKRAQAELKSQGYGLKVWDAYRPPKAQVALWNSHPNSGYIASPYAGLSKHCSGIAVDVTLVDSSGREMKMPTGYDDFSSRASANYSGSDPEVRKNLRILQTAMRNAGVYTIQREWWHFNDPRSMGSRPVRASELNIQLPLHVQSLNFQLASNVPSSSGYPNSSPPSRWSTPD